MTDKTIIDTRRYYKLHELLDSFDIEYQDIVFTIDDIKELTDLGIIHYSYVFTDGEYGYTYEDLDDYIESMDDLFTSENQVKKYLRKHNIKNKKDIMDFFQRFPVLKVDIDLYILGYKVDHLKLTVNEHIYNFIIKLVKYMFWSVVFLVTAIVLIFILHVISAIIPIWVIFVIILFIFTVGQITIR